MTAFVRFLFLVHLCSMPSQPTALLCSEPTEGTLPILTRPKLTASQGPWIPTLGGTIYLPALLSEIFHTPPKGLHISKLPSISETAFGGEGSGRRNRRIYSPLLLERRHEKLALSPCFPLMWVWQGRAWAPELGLLTAVSLHGFHFSRFGLLSWEVERITLRGLPR